jgi:amidase
MDQIVFLPAHKLASLIRERELCSREVIEAFIDHIHQRNHEINAVVTVNADQARAAAMAADTALKAGTILGPLHGVPFTVKDILKTQGVRTTFGLKAYANYIPTEDATVVARLKSAGGILLGKTNIPKKAFDIQTNHPLFGRTNNPWNLDLTCGGSSGGGAAAVCAGFSPLDIGNDMAGSQRLPAHFCGVYGFKPTEHRTPISSPLKVKSIRYLLAIGATARSIPDLSLALDCIEGADHRDWHVPPKNPEQASHRSLNQLRIAWFDDFGVPIDQNTQAALAKFTQNLKQHHCVVEKACPTDLNFDAALQTFVELLIMQSMIVTSSPIKTLQSIITSLLPTKYLPLSPLWRGYIRGSRLNLRQYMETLTQRDQITGVIDQFLAEWDCWICPVAPGPAFSHQGTANPYFSSLQVDQQEIPYWTWGISHTSLFNLTGNPVVVIPIQTEPTPIGIQIIGRRWQDMELLSIAQKIVDAFPVYQAPPAFA